MKHAFVLVFSLFMFAASIPAVGEDQPPGGESGTALPDGAERKPGGMLVSIEQQKQEAIGVNVTEVAPRRLQKTVRTVGRIEYDETRLVTVNLRFEGWIEKLHADYTGRAVKAGELLADVYSPELYSAQLEFVNLLKWKDQKGHRFQRNVEFNWGDRFGTVGRMLTFDIEALLDVAREKLDLWEVPLEAVQRIEERQETMRLFPVRSPITGYLVDKPALEGMRFSPGEKIFDIVDLSVLWVIADIYESDLPFVSVGQPAEISLSYLPEKTFKAKIDYIYPTLDERTRTVKIRFVLPNPEGDLKPAMYTNVAIGADLGEFLAVPEDSVIDTGERQIVYVARGEGSFEQRTIRVGRRAGDLVEILDGLEEGEQIVRSALFLIDSEARLQQTGKTSCCAQ